MQHPLDPPTGIGDDEDAMEVVRAWLADGTICVSLHTGWGRTDEDTREDCWGRLLADLVFHVGRALEQESGYPAKFVRAQVLQSMRRHLQNDPEGYSGELLDDDATKA